MSILRLLQDTGAIKDGPLFSLKALDYELENMKQIIKEKDVIIENNNEKIHELENHITELQENCLVLQQQLTMARVPDSLKKNAEVDENLKEEHSQMPGIIQNYEKLISDMTANYESVKEERDIASAHLASLECSFADLLEKYERLKNIVLGYQQNQEVLLNQINIYQEAMVMMQERYESFKKYATDKLNEACAHVEKNDKKHISELAKVKSKVLQSQAKISELEKTISIMSVNQSAGDAGPNTDPTSMFAPLSNNFVN